MANSFLGFIKIFGTMFQKDRDEGIMLDNIIKFMETKPSDFPGLIYPVEESKPCQSFSRGKLEEGSKSPMSLSSLKRTYPYMLKLIKNMFKGRSLYQQPMVSNNQLATPDLFEEVKRLAKELGPIDVKFIKDVPRKEIFQDRSIPHRNVFVFVVEMQNDKIQMAPSLDTYLEVNKGYGNLAVISNAVTEFLRSRGYSAYPSTALGGPMDYVAIGELAGLGAIGRHGLLITPQAGARVRISTVYTDIEGLPDQNENEHLWIRDFCRECGQCSRECPVGAIYDEAKDRIGGDKISIEYKQCVKYFAMNYGCAKCIKVCPFSSYSYEKIKNGYIKSQKTKNELNSDFAIMKPENRTNVAVIGAGPSGFFVVKEILENTQNVYVDIYERLPYPFGLLRYGVAPDHEEVKSKAFTFIKILKNDRVRFFGNVTFGQDVTHAELKDKYSAIFYTVGASNNKRLGIQGENLLGSMASSEFISWYNGHPYFKSLNPVLNANQAVVIGHGNVALDAVRMLTKDTGLLRATDIASYALETLKDSQVQDIYIVGRGGPSNANFTPRELVELSEVTGVDFVVDPMDIEKDRNLEGLVDSLNEKNRRNLELFTEFSRKSVDLSNKNRKRVHFKFFLSPNKIIGDDKVESIEFIKNDISFESGDYKIVPTSKHESIQCGLVMRSIGYLSDKLPDVPYNEMKGTISNSGGRVTDELGNIVTGEYTSGWVRRGATGIIGTNKVDANETVGHFIEDLPILELQANNPSMSVEELLTNKTVRVINKEEILKILTEERFRGGFKRRKAIKFADDVDVVEFLAEKGGA